MGQPALFASGGFRANLAKAQTARGPDPPEAAFLGADRRGGENAGSEPVSPLVPLGKGRDEGRRWTNDSRF